MPDSSGLALGALPGTNLIEYSFPLRPDHTVFLTLPRDLRLNEVRRITAFLETLIDITATSGFNP
jgi:hypothetical protein